MPCFEDLVNIWRLNVKNALDGDVGKAANLAPVIVDPVDLR